LKEAMAKNYLRMQVYDKKQKTLRKQSGEFFCDPDRILECIFHKAFRLGAKCRMGELELQKLKYILSPAFWQCNVSGRCCQSEIFCNNWTYGMPPALQKATCLAVRAFSASSLLKIVN